MPIILLKSASKQLQEGYKAARNRLSAGSTKSSSFSERDMSRNASFDSSSSDRKQSSRHSGRFPIVHEVSQELDESTDRQSARKQMDSPQTPKDSRKSSILNISEDSFISPSPVRRLLGRTGSNTPKEGSTPLSFRLRRKPSSSSRTSQGESEGMSPGMSPGLLSLLKSPETPASAATAMAQISSIFHSSLTSLKRGFDSQNSGAVNYEAEGSSETTDQEKDGEKQDPA
jgi:hypothetical protein